LGTTVAEALDEINCGLARDRGEEEGIKTVSRRIEIAYKAGKVVSPEWH